MIFLLLVICLSCLAVVGVVVKHHWHRPDYALTARLEHELMSGPFDHASCNLCYKDRFRALQASTARTEALIRSASGPGGTFDALTYYNLRPKLMRPEYNAVARPDATIKTLGGEDFRGTNSG